MSQNARIDLRCRMSEKLLMQKAAKLESRRGELSSFLIKAGMEKTRRVLQKHAKLKAMDDPEYEVPEDVDDI